MKASQKNNPAPENISRSLSRGWLLLAIAVLLIIGTTATLIQPPNPDPFRDDSLLDRFLYPIEVNAFQRLPAINNALNDLHVSSDNQHIWVVGEGGLIVHSADAGMSWVQQNPPLPVTPVKQGISMVETLISGAQAAAPAPEFFDQFNQAEQTADLQQQQVIEGNNVNSPKNPSLEENTIPQTNFPTKTPDVSKDTRLLLTPNLVGMSEKQANLTLKKSGLTPGKKLEKDSQEKPGIVLSQNPAAGIRIKQGSRIDLVISKQVVATPIEPDPVEKKRILLDPMLQTLNSIYFLDDAKHGWAVGDSGSILLTVDGGSHWKAVKSRDNKNLNSVFFHSKDEGWTVGTDNILMTHDGGNNWNKLGFDFKSEGINSVFFTSETRGWAVGYAGSMFYYSQDGTGSFSSPKKQSWEWLVRESALSKGATLRSVYFTDDNNGWIVGNEGTMLARLDGENWNLIDSGTSVQLNTVQFFNHQHGWVAGENRTIRLTTDGGKTWKNKNSGTKISLGYTADIDNKSKAFRDSKSHFKEASKQSQESEKGPMIMDLYFTDPDHGWAVDNTGSILSTDNAGESWILRTRNKHWQLPDSRYQRYPALWYYLLIGLALLLLHRLSQRQEKSSAQQESIADQLVSDRPLSRDDQDVLNLTAIADGLSRFIRNTRTEAPLTVAVTGAWGSGKSSLMNLLREDLEARSYRPIWFNAWHHQKGENLLASLVANIRTQGVPSLIARGSFGFRWRLLLLRGWRHWFKSAAMLLLLIVSAGFIWSIDNPLSAVPEMVRSLRSLELDSLGLGAIGGLLIPLAALIKALQAFGLNPKSMMHDMTDGMRRGKLAANPGARYQFAQEFNDVTRALDSRKMVILIDDLDRCQPDHVVEVLETVNYLMTSGRCFVILGMDLDYVEACVGLKFEVLANATAQNGSEDNPEVEDRQSFARHYMEKLVNLRVTIPALDDQKSQQLLISESTPKKPDNVWRLFSRVLENQGYRVLGAIFLTTIIWGGWQGGEWVHQYLRITTTAPTGEPGEMDTTLNSITFLDQQRGFAVGEKGRIIQTTDGGETWHTNSGELIKGFVADTDKKEPDAPTPTPSTPEPEQKTESKLADFKHPQENIVQWPGYSFPVLAALAMLVGLFFMLRRPTVTEKDSPLFIRALEIWQPWIVLKRQTPRLLKRFLNEVRYLAMQYRTPAVRRSRLKRVAAIIERIAGKPETALQMQDDIGLNEAKIVALSAIYQLNPAWISDQTTFQGLINGESVMPLLEKDFTELFKNNLGEIDLQRLNEVALKMDTSITIHLGDASISTQFPNENDRKQFLDALHGIRVKPKPVDIQQAELAISA